MSFYPQRGRRWPGLLAALAVGLLLGGIGGAVAGRATAPSLAEQARELRRQTAGLLSRLEVLTVEYPQAVRGGQVVGRTEYDGSVARVENARNALAGLASDLRAVDPAGYEQAQAAVDRLAADVDARADPATVAARVRQVRAALTGAA